MRFWIILTAALLAGRLASAQTPAAPAPAAPGRTASGIEYRLFRKGPDGRFAPRALAVPTDAPYASRAGQFLTVFMDFRTGRDSLLMNSRRVQPRPQPFPLLPAPPPGTLEEAVALLLPGDSAVFRLPADTLFAKSFQGQPVPPFIKKAGNVLVVSVQTFELVSRDELMAREQQLRAEQAQVAAAASAKQLVKDNAQIQAYLKKNKLVAHKTAGGTYYVITRAGKGALPKKGQTVSVLYKGSLLATGKVFDASAQHDNKPIDFPLGTGQVIPGWDQGIAALPKGSKAVLLIPSPLGYGARGAGADIPANAVLRFDVELVGVK
ncbi:FKBP-type peptidyl-prolyl cis-trans isomerase [Hymenobacter caeli]|uniref:peptidylprolyl isomerase n=1 Tax=Hymenobacter caeli TaxID=2735894 RepID=A0ABX2FTU0_9BACT|nr:FKBP-type peptidyl-prolyl cis-trans isomerase [Hymenobacter caeli]NRT20611.1 FKBP-type peptidyl-prolyl cis-trans isomerase [Hymenobacter caeli]